MELDDVQRDLQALAHDFAEREMRPLAARVRRVRGVPVAGRPQGGRGRADVLRPAGGVRRRRRRQPRHRGRDHRGAGLGLLRDGRLHRRRRLLRRPDRGARHAGAEGALAAAAVLADRPRDRRARDHRAERRLRRRRHDDVGREGRRRLRAERPEDVDLVRADGRPVHRVRQTVAPGSRSRGITAFLLLRGDEGFEIGKKMPKMGAAATRRPSCSSRTASCADDRRLGDEGQGFYGLMRWFDVSRVTLGANGVGIGRAALEYAVEYAKEREQFGKKIHEFQAVSFRLVDAKMKLDQARLLTYHAAALADAGKPFAIEAAQAKLAGSEAAWFATWAASMTLGGYSYSREYPVERWLRAPSSRSSTRARPTSSA